MEKLIDKVLEKYPPNKKELLIPILQEIQGASGYLNSEILDRVGKHLAIPANKVYGVATFYDQFRFRPRGKWHFQVCAGTSCHLFGNTTVRQALELQLGIKSGQTTRNGRFSLEEVQCIGACNHSPVVLLNGKPLLNLTQESLTRILETLEE